MNRVVMIKTADVVETFPVLVMQGPEQGPEQGPDLNANSIAGMDDMLTYGEQTCEFK